MGKVKVRTLGADERSDGARLRAKRDKGGRVLWAR